MRQMMRRMLTTTILLCAVVPLAGQQLRADLAGRWVREGGATPVLDETEPAWEELSLDVGAVALTRAGDVARKMTLLTDGVERASAADPNRRCRSTWEAERLVTECRDTSGGPGGLVPPLYTREARWLDARGAMVVETTWISGERTVTRTSTYRRAEAR